MAIGAGPEAHPDPARRYVAGVACGVFFCLAGVFGGSIVAALTLLPGEVIALLAGLALLGPIGRGLSEMMADPREAQAGLLTFVVTASGAGLWGLGGSFWGIVVGIAAAAAARIFRAG
jgi:benzoate membrane transport protein